MFLSTSALNISGYSGTLMVGESANIICSSDLDGTRIQWLYNGTVVANSSSSQANLIFNPVSDSLHNRQYTCRVSNMYGSVEQTITISVQGKLISYLHMKLKLNGLYILQFVMTVFLPFISSS